MVFKLALRIAAMAAASALISPVVLAAGFDGKSNLVCAATDVVACAEAFNCVEARAGVFELPDFMYVDFERKIVHARLADATAQVQSQIRGQIASERALILQGFENHQGWTLSVNRESGRMTTSVAGGPASYMIRGVCTPI